MIDYPSKNFLDMAFEAINNGDDMEIRVVNKSRRKYLMESLPLLIRNQDQKEKIWKTIFRWFYLMDFLAFYGTVIEKKDYYISYTTNDEVMKILFERQNSTTIKGDVTI